MAASEIQSVSNLFLRNRRRRILFKTRCIFFVYFFLECDKQCLEFSLFYFPSPKAASTLKGRRRTNNSEGRKRPCQWVLRGRERRGGGERHTLWTPKRIGGAEWNFTLLLVGGRATYSALVYFLPRGLYFCGWGGKTMHVALFFYPTFIAAFSCLPQTE